MATSSDDKSVIVWDINKEVGHPSFKKVLIGHSKNVRGLLWNTEIPYILLSGSWDASIILWDVRTSSALSTIAQHTSDVYGLTSNPERPFSFVSSSRDSTIRFWSYESLIEPIRIKLLIREAYDDVHKPFSETMLQPVGLQDNPQTHHLYGPVSQKLCERLLSNDFSSPAEKYKAIMDFLYLSDGQSEFWDLVNAISDGSPGSAGSRVLHISDMARAYESKANELLTVNRFTMLGTMMIKKRDRQMTAAKIFFKLGKYKKFCDIMMQIGEHEKALSFAPLVSLQYWQKCMEKYNLHLEENGDLEEMALTKIGINSTEDLVQILERKKNFEDAKIIRLMSLGGVYEQT